MTPARRPEAAKRSLEEARERLDHARTYQGGSHRILCEQAHYATEYAIKSVIIARGQTFPTVHDHRPAPEHCRTADAGQHRALGSPATTGPQPSTEPGWRAHCRHVQCGPGLGRRAQQDPTTAGGTPGPSDERGTRDIMELEGETARE